MIVHWLRLCTVFLVLAGVARAEQPFFELDGFNGFWGSGGVPDGAFKLLKEVQQAGDAELKCFAFTLQVDWVFLFGGNGYYASNLELPACKKLTELQKDNADFKCVAFAPTGRWTLLWGGNGNWTEGKILDAAFAKMQEVGNRNGKLRSIAFGPHGHHPNGDAFRSGAADVLLCQAGERTSGLSIRLAMRVVGGSGRMVRLGERAGTVSERPAGTQGPQSTDDRDDVHGVDGV